MEERSCGLTLALVRLAKEESNANLPRNLVLQLIVPNTSPMTVRSDRNFYHDKVNVRFDILRTFQIEITSARDTLKKLQRSWTTKARNSDVRDDKLGVLFT